MKRKRKRIFLNQHEINNGYIRTFNPFKQQPKKCLLKKCHWTEMNWRGAKLGRYDQSVSFNSSFNAMRNKFFSFKIQKFSRFFRVFFPLELSFAFLICSIEVNSAYCWKLWLGLLKCLQANFGFSLFASFLRLFRRSLKVASLFPTICFVVFIYFTYNLLFSTGIWRLLYKEI